MDKYNEIVKVLGPTNEEDIVAAENALEIKLPKEYRDYVKLYGAGCVLGFMVMGVQPWLTMSIVESTETWRRLGVDKKYIPIYDVDDSGLY